MISYIDRKNKKYIYNINPSEQELMKMICPKCNSQGQFYRHGFYVRFLVLFSCVANIFIKDKIEVTVLRVRCTNCNKTHAILDFNIIPYCSYSVSFIFEVLSCYFIDQNKIEDICIEFDISEYTFNLFVDHYNKEMLDLKAYYKNIGLDALFEELVNDEIDSFLVNFFKLTKRYLFHFVSSGTLSIFKNRSFHITFFAY